VSVSEFERAVLILQGMKFDGNFCGDSTTLPEGGARSLMMAIVGAVREDLTNVFAQMHADNVTRRGISTRSERIEEAVRQVIREHAGNCECISILKAAIK